MSDLLKKYLDESCCSHCFNIDSECNKCVEKLLAEHDSKVRADAIEEYKDRLLELCDCGIERAYCTGANCLKCMDNSVDYSSIIDLAEELEEKKK